MLYSNINIDSIDVNKTINISINNINKLNHTKDYDKIFDFIVSDNYNFDCLLNTLTWFSDSGLYKDSDKLKTNINNIRKYNSFLSNNDEYKKLIIQLNNHIKNDDKKSLFINNVYKNILRDKSRSIISIESQINKNINELETEHININDIISQITTHLKEQKFTLNDINPIINNIKVFIQKNNIHTHTNIKELIQCMYNIKNKHVYDTIVSSLDSYIIYFIYIILNRKLLSKQLKYDNYLYYVLDHSYDLFGLFKHNNFLESFGDLINFILTTINKNDITVFNIIRKYTTIKNNSIQYTQFYDILMNHLNKCTKIYYNPLNSFNNTLLMICKLLGLKLKSSNMALNKNLYLYDGDVLLCEINCLVKQSNNTNISLYKLNNRIYNNKTKKYSTSIINILIEYDIKNHGFSFIEYTKVLDICIEIIFNSLQHTSYGVVNNSYYVYFNSIIKSYIYTLTNLKKINSNLTDGDIELIHDYITLQYEYFFKHRCLYILFYIFSYSSDKFIVDCKQIISEDTKNNQVDTTVCMENINQYNTKITSYIKNIYHNMFETIMSYNTLKISHDVNDFHPIYWTNYIKDTPESINAVDNMLSEIYGIQFMNIYNSLNNQEKQIKIKELLQILRDPPKNLNIKLQYRYFEQHITGLNTWGLCNNNNTETEAMLNDIVVKS